MSPFFLRTAAVAGLGWALTACTTFEQARACQSLAEAMNPPLEEIQAEAALPSNGTPAFIRAQADRYRALAQRLDVARPQLDPLGQTSKSFAAEFRLVAGTLDEAAEAREQSSASRYRAARLRLETSSVRLRDFEKQLARRCS